MGKDCIPQICRPEKIQMFVVLFLVDIDGLWQHRQKQLHIGEIVLAAVEYSKWGVNAL